MHWEKAPGSTATSCATRCDFAGYLLATNLRSMELHCSGRLHKAIQCGSLSIMYSLQLWGATTSSVECYVPRCSSLRRLTLATSDREAYGGPRLELHELQFLTLYGSMFFCIRSKSGAPNCCPSPPISGSARPSHHSWTPSSRPESQSISADASLHQPGELSESSRLQQHQTACLAQ